jgi:hypothetical protein
MATTGDHVTVHSGPHPAAHEILGGWLGLVDAHLPGRTKARQAMLVELEDGLLAAFDAHRRRGLPPAAAARAAAAEFGDPRSVARALSVDLAAAQARRTVLAILPTGPLLGVLWLLALVASHRVSLSLPPWHAQGPWVLFPALAAALAIGVPAALLTVAATGRPSRWLPDRPRLAPTAAATAGIAGVVIDLSLLGMLVAQAIVAPAQLAWTPASVAAIASLIRLALCGRAAHRCLAVRAKLA